MLIFSGILGFFALLIAGTILRGFMLSVMWGWFVVPLFHLPVLSIPYAIGLAVTASLFAGTKSSKTDDKKKTADKIAEWIAQIILGPFLVLGVAWIVKQFL